MRHLSLLVSAFPLVFGAYWDVNGPVAAPEDGLPLKPVMKRAAAASDGECAAQCAAHDKCIEAVLSNGTCMLYSNVVFERGTVAGATYFARDRGEVFIDCVGQELYADMCQSAEDGITTCEGWKGDGTCDNGFNVSDSMHQIFLNCANHQFDGGDCDGSGSPTEGQCAADFIEHYEESQCEVPADGEIEDCWGQVLTDEDCAVAALGITTCAAWKGDGSCDGGQTLSDAGYIINFNCAAHNYDGGDCEESQPDPTPNPTASPTARDCVHTEWTVWQDCDAECGGGEQKRTRDIHVHPTDDGLACDVLEETQACNEQACPTPSPTARDCGYSNWSVWGDCDAECAGGMQSRTREITVEPTTDGIQCGDLSEQQACNEQACPTPSPTARDCVHSEWTGWQDCDAECGGGMQTRTREILTSPTTDGEQCGDLAEEQSCNAQPCPTPSPTVVDCEVSEWSDFGDCDQECDGGLKTRTRTVTVPASESGAACPALSEDDDCNMQACPTPGPTKNPTRSEGEYVDPGKCLAVVSNALSSSGFAEDQIDAATAVMGEYQEITRPWDDSAELLCNGEKTIYQATHHGEGMNHAVLCYGQPPFLVDTELYVFFSKDDGGAEMYGRFEGACSDVTWDLVNVGACQSICDGVDCHNEAQAESVRPCGLEPTAAPEPVPTQSPTEELVTPAPVAPVCATKATFDASCLISQDKQTCEGNGCKWKKGECKMYDYKNGKTKKLKCKKLTEENCECYSSIDTGCKLSYKKGVFKKCGGKMVWREELHGPSLES